MKKLLLSAGVTACCLFSPAPSFAQWDPVTDGINYAGGNVGVGTTTPRSKLDLGSNFGPAGTAPNKISLYWQANNNYYGFVVSAGTLDYFSTGFHRFHAFDLNGVRQEVFSILQNGNVGVGVTNPLIKLQVNSGNIGQSSSGTFGDANGKWSALGQPPTAFPTGGQYFGLFRNWAQQSFITGLLDNGTKKDGVIAWGDATATVTSPRWAPAPNSASASSRARVRVRPTRPRFPKK